MIVPCADYYPALAIVVRCKGNPQPARHGVEKIVVLKGQLHLWCCAPEAVFCSIFEEEYLVKIWQIEVRIVLVLDDVFDRLYDTAGHTGGNKTKLGKMTDLVICHNCDIVKCRRLKAFHGEYLFVGTLNRLGRCRPERVMVVVEHGQHCVRLPVDLIPVGKAGVVVVSRGCPC